MKQKFGLIAILFLAITLVLVGCNPKEKPEEKPTAEFNALGDWTGDAAYTITENKKEELSFSYAKGTTPNAVLKSATITEDLSKMQTLVITLEGLGTVMVEIVNKDGNSIKVYLTIPVVKDTYQWNLKQDADFMKGVNQVRITAAPGKENSVGNAKVTSLLFKEAVASGFIIAKDYTDIDETVHEYAGEAGDWHFNSKWHVGNTNDEAIYDIKTEGTKVTVNVSKDSAGSYALMRVLIKGDFSNFNFVVVKAKGKAGEKVLLKIRDNPQAEQTFRFTGEDQFLFYDISNWTAAEKKALDRVMIFALPGLTTGTTSFEIQDVYLTDKYDTGIIKNVYNGLVNEFVIKNYYDIAGEGYKVQNNANGESVVEYKKTDNTYPPLISYITGDISRFNFAEIVVTGTAGKKMMVKIEGTGANFEQEIEFNGNKQTIGLDIISKLKADQRKGINRVIIYAEPGTKDVEGKFTIHSFTFKDKVLNITDRLKDADRKSVV